MSESIKHNQYINEVKEFTMINKGYGAVFMFSNHKKICSYHNKKDISKLPRVNSSNRIGTMCTLELPLWKPCYMLIHN